MSNIVERLLAYNASERLAVPENGLTRRHAAAHIIVLLIYILIIASFPKYAVIQLVPLVLIPAVYFQIAELPFKLILKRLLFIEPLILFVALMNPIFARDPVTIGNITLSVGWLIALSLVVKSILTLTVALQLGFMLGMGRLAGGLQFLKVPPLFIEVISLSYRYLIVLMEETLTLFRAYKLRAPHHEGVRYTHWGSFAGNLILRSFDRAVRIEQAMAIRGSGDFRQFHESKWQNIDLFYVLGMTLFCLLVRLLTMLF